MRSGPRGGPGRTRLRPGFARDGKANMAWTDMRRFTTVDDVSGYAQNSFFARR
jgi:hypothetical protein